VAPRSSPAPLPGADQRDLPGGPLRPAAVRHRIKAFVVHLLVSQMVALKRVQQTLATLISRFISEATLLKWVLQLHQALAEWNARPSTSSSPSPLCTWMRPPCGSSARNHWIHVCFGRDITLKCLHQRGLEAIRAINIIPRYGGTIIHDCWASYLSYTHCGHGLCGPPAAN